MVLSEVRVLPMGFAGSFSQTMKTISYRVVQLKFTPLGYGYLQVCVLLRFVYYLTQNTDTSFFNIRMISSKFITLCTHL